MARPSGRATRAPPRVGRTLWPTHFAPARCLLRSCGSLDDCNATSVRSRELSSAVFAPASSHAICRSRSRAFAKDWLHALCDVPDGARVGGRRRVHRAMPQYALALKTAMPHAPPRYRPAHRPLSCQAFVARAETRTARIRWNQLLEGGSVLLRVARSPFVARHHHVDVGIVSPFRRRAGADLDEYGIAIAAVDQAMAVRHAGLPRRRITRLEGDFFAAILAPTTSPSST
jgi:hypothetical protein